MKWYWWVLIIAVILIVVSYLIYKNKPDGKKLVIDGLNGNFGDVLQESITNSYQNCLDNLKKLPDGSPCTECQDPNIKYLVGPYIGKIKSGICQRNAI